MADMILEKNPQETSSKQAIYNELLSHKLEFIKPMPKKNIRLRRPKSRRRLVPTSPPKPKTPERAESTGRKFANEGLPYHYSRFQRNLHAYNLEYNAKEKHVVKEHPQ